MSVYSLCFSPTGGTKNVMGILSEEIPIDQEVDLSQPHVDFGDYHFKTDDVCLIGVPSFGGRAPATALERIKQMKADGALAILVVVFGNRAYDDTLLELKNEVSDCGFVVGAAITAVAEHSIVRKYGVGRPDENDRDQLLKHAKSIQKMIASGQSVKAITVPGNQPYKEYGGVPMKPKANKDCTKCGTCAAKCPVEAIPTEDPSSTNEALCISCMRCISICPQQARTLNKAMLFAAAQGLKKACSTRKESELYL